MRFHFHDRKMDLLQKSTGGFHAARDPWMFGPVQGSGSNADTERCNSSSMASSMKSILISDGKP